MIPINYMVMLMKIQNSGLNLDLSEVNGVSFASIDFVLPNFFFFGNFVLPNRLSLLAVSCFTIFWSKSKCGLKEFRKGKVFHSFKFSSVSFFCSNMFLFL
ncbi:hypothetical protein NE237_015842 [Protea cynaroides]|uniref:Uncharacterized protein n=1 Tax=Protea cynaroides TaxID=273540 RepID=A0A9Q0KF21_9MAGN|nr:hypothetical protein NE237_015842 [Protea cynaroides]